MTAHSKVGLAFFRRNLIVTAKTFFAESGLSVMVMLALENDMRRLVFSRPKRLVVVLTTTTVTGTIFVIKMSVLLFTTTFARIV